MYKSHIVATDINNYCRIHFAVSAIHLVSVGSNRARYTITYYTNICCIRTLNQRKRHQHTRAHTYRKYLSIQYFSLSFLFVTSVLFAALLYGLRISFRAEIFFVCMCVCVCMPSFHPLGLL